MATNYTFAVDGARASAVVTAAGTGALIRIYSGSAPTDADTALGSQVLLATLTIAGALGTVSNTTGVLTFGAVTSGTAVATGTAGFARVLKSDGTTVVFDLTSVSTSGADINLNSTSIQSGGTVSVTSGTSTEPHPQSLISLSIS